MKKVILCLFVMALFMMTAPMPSRGAEVIKLKAANYSGRLK
jgi:hypothetical protein